MKTLKRMFALLLAVICAASLMVVPLYAFTNDSDKTKGDSKIPEGLTIIHGPEEYEEGKPVYRYEPVCGTYHSHRMMASGLGFVQEQDGSVYIWAGAAWQCTRCKLVIVTEGDLYWWGMSPIGKYATINYWPDNINANGCYIYGAEHYGYTSANHLPGYKFYFS